MANSPKKLCGVPGCSTLTKNTHCSKHERKWHFNKPRPSAHRRLYDHRWRKASKAFLASNPMCRAHAAEGVHCLATVVDHIKPHRGDVDLFWDEGNWQGLCKRKHDEKTARGE